MSELSPSEREALRLASRDSNHAVDLLRQAYTTIHELRRSLGRRPSVTFNQEAVFYSLGTQLELTLEYDNGTRVETTVLVTNCEVDPLVVERKDHEWVG